MIFQVPTLPPEYQEVIEKIMKLRDDLRFTLSDNLNRWHGFLARMNYARSIHQSNFMEGINATFEDAVAVVDDEAPQNPSDENWKALQGYRDAMDYVIQLAKNKSLYQHNAQTLNALHFMVTKYDLKKSPGQFRGGPVSVTNTETNDVVYEGPPPEMVSGLIGELLEGLNAQSTTNVLVRAAMAHLNLTMIHPYRDGNGRMARILQTFVLAQEGILDPRFSSIEEYVGRNSGYYYRVLAEVGQGKWAPQNSALPWIKFCLRAHYWQAESLLRRMEQSGKLWTALESEIARRGLPDRTINALMSAAYGLKVRNPSYRQESEVSVQVAKIDLKNLVTAGLLEPRGETRGRYYVASEELNALWKSTFVGRAWVEPFPDADSTASSTLAQVPRTLGFFADEG